MSFEAFLVKNVNRMNEKQFEVVNEMIEIIKKGKRQSINSAAQKCNFMNLNKNDQMPLYRAIHTLMSFTPLSDLEILEFLRDTYIKKVINESK
ncbi:hypothetical protein ABD68_06380 [Bacillus endophyticus]|uniref:hypothetical protein n=1 Tax=Priestia endophytica TaxID=135735 RepID=UPI0018CDC3FB|nr:hypothetical protein [Priestia endophytica]MBG9811239.1 hypothetical protein [Priestia endophytica]